MIPSKNLVNKGHQQPRSLSKIDFQEQGFHPFVTI